MQEQANTVITKESLEKCRAIIEEGGVINFLAVENVGSRIKVGALDVTVGALYGPAKLDSDGDVTVVLNNQEPGFINTINPLSTALVINHSEAYLNDWNRTSKLKKAEKLQAAALIYRIGHSFSIGDLVELKPGMKHKTVPEYGQPCVIVDVLDTPLIDQSRHDSAYSTDRNDIIVGVMNEESFITWFMDSRRFKRFEK